MAESITPEEWALRVKTDKARPIGADDQKLIDTMKELCGGEIEPRVAAGRIADAYNNQIREHKLSYWKVWTIYMDAVISLGGPSDERVLPSAADTLVEISKLPDVIDDDGQIVRSDGSGGRVYWRDVPMFTFYFYDMLEVYHTNVHWMSASAFEAAARRRFNTYTFAIHYLRALESNGGPRCELNGMKQTTLRCVWDAIEIGGTSAASDRRLELLVPAAAQYMCSVPDLIYRYCQERWGREGDDKHEPLRSGGEDGGKMLWTGYWGYSLKRWHFWKERLGYIGVRLEGVDADVSRQCAEAVLSMKKVDGRI